MHVTHVTAPAAFGGLERVLTGLCPGLAADGIGVTLVAVLEPDAPEPDFLRAVRRQGVEVVAVHVSARGYADERRQVLALLASRGTDVVHTHGYRSDVIVGTAARRAGYPTVSTLHGFTRQGLRGLAYEWIQLRTLRRADAVVAVSDVLAEQLAGRGIPADRISVIRNGVVGTDASLLSRELARERLGLGREGPVVGWVGRLSVEKDPQLAIRGFAEASVDGAVMCFVGDGPQLESTRALADELGLGDRVHFAGVVEGAADLFRAFDLLVLSSRTEGTPMAILEAAVAGIPVVATAVGGVPAMLGEDSGTLVPPGNAGALGAAVRRALGDPQVARDLVSALRDRVMGPRVGEWIERYAALYRGLVEQESEADA